MAASLVLQIVTDATKAVSGFGKVDKAAADTGKKVQGAGSKFAGIAKGVATGFAVGAVLSFGKSSVKAAEESAVASEKLASTMRGAGDATGKAAAAAEKYAGKLSKQTGIDDEVVMGGQAILATFHSVSGEAGRTAGIFDRATAAGADLAAAGFGSIESNAVQLGKALEDPTKGMTALAKSGVTFTAQQKAQIVAMQKSGNLLGAQKIVLGAVEGQVKGTAAATATSSAKMATAFGNFQEAIGAVLLPIISKLMDSLSGVFAFITANSGWLVPIVLAVTGLAVAFLAISKAIAITKAAIEGVTLVWRLLNLAFAASPIGLIVIAILAVIAILVLLYLKVAWFRNAVNAAFNAVLGVAKYVWNAILTVIQFVWNWLKRNWPLVLGILTGPIGLAVVLIIRYWDQITGGLKKVLGWFQTGWSAAYNAVIKPILDAVGWIERAFGDMISWLGGVPGAIGRALAGVFNAVISPFKAAWQWIQDHILGPLKGAWNGIANVVNAVHIKTPGLKVAGHTIVPSFDWRPPFRIPTLDQGGIISGPTLALLSANSRPEAVIPLSRLSQRQDVRVIVNVPATANPAETGRAVATALRAFFSAGGRLEVPA